jgi:hypothetical protein
VEVFGRRAEHTGTPDIDFLNGFAGLQPLGQSALEIVKVHADEIKCLDSLFFQNGEVLGVVLVGEDAAVDVGMQRLHPAAEDFGEAGHVADRGDGQARVFKEFQRAAGGDELHAVGVQKGCEFRQSVLMGDAEQSPPDGKEIHSIRS